MGGGKETKKSLVNLENEHQKKQSFKKPDFRELISAQHRNKLTR